MKEHARCKGVRHSEAREIGREIPAWQLQVVVAPLENRIERFADTSGDGRGDRDPVAAEQTADDDIDVAVDRCAEIGVPGELHLLVVIRARRNKDIRKYLKLFQDAFSRDVHTGVDLVSVPPLEVVVDVRELCSVITALEVEHRVVEHVWPHLVQTPEVLGAERGEHAAVHPPVALAGEEAGLRVEVRRDLGVPERQTRPL